MRKPGASVTIYAYFFLMPFLLTIETESSNDAANRIGFAKDAELHHGQRRLAKAGGQFVVSPSAVATALTGKLL
jgi:hypothetical protein